MWAAVVLVSAGGVGLAGARYWAARDRATSERSRAGEVSQRLHEIARLRSSAPAWMVRGKPSTGLTPRISAALSACGLPASAMSSLSPEAESPLGDRDIKARRSRAVLTLAPVTLPQLGGFLAAWRSREPDWTVSSIDLALQSGNGQGAAAGGDLPLRAVLGLETLFVDQPPDAPPPAGAFVSQSGGAR
jgi:hypothetical protein